MNSIEHKSLAHPILSQKVVQDAYSAAKDMNREKLIEVVQWIALSHERLRAELEGAEAMLSKQNEWTDERGMPLR